LGHRQVGKTTLAESLGTKYVTLDSPTDLALALTDAAGFLAENAAMPLIIDECQLAPPLFPALKEWVRSRKKPGQFLLTGSVRFSSRKAIRESLTGRIVTWELLPMDWAEQHNQPLSDSLIRIAMKVTAPLQHNPTFTPQAYRKHLENGGLPGVFGVRDPSIRAQRFDTQINTILERDLRLLLQTTLPFKSLRGLFVAVARQVGAPLEVTTLSRETRISLPTLRKLLPVLESLFLIRTVPCEGDYSKPLVFLEDVGELSHLLTLSPDDPRLVLSFLHQNLRTQFHYRPELKAEQFAFRSVAGHFVPICYRIGPDKVLGLIPLGQGIEAAHRDAKAFIKSYPKASALIVGIEDKDVFLGPRIRWVGMGRLI